MWRHEMLAVVVVFCFCFCFFVLFCFVFFISLYVQLSAILNLYRCYTCTHFSAKIRALKILSYICRLMLIIHSYNDMYIKTHHKVNIFYLYYIKVRCHHKKSFAENVYNRYRRISRNPGLYFRFRFCEEALAVR